MLWNNHLSVDIDISSCGAPPEGVNSWSSTTESSVLKSGFPDDLGEIAHLWDVVKLASMVKFACMVKLACMALTWFTQRSLFPGRQFQHGHPFLVHSQQTQQPLPSYTPVTCGVLCPLSYMLSYMLLFSIYGILHLLSYKLCHIFLFSMDIVYYLSYLRVFIHGLL